MELSAAPSYLQHASMVCQGKQQQQQQPAAGQRRALPARRVGPGGRSRPTAATRGAAAAAVGPGIRHGKSTPMLAEQLLPLTPPPTRPLTTACAPLDVCVQAVSGIYTTLTYPVHRVKILLQTQDANPRIISGVRLLTAFQKPSRHLPSTFGASSALPPACCTDCASQ